MPGRMGLIGAALLLCMAGPLSAQQGAIAGTVRNEEGAAVQNAVVETLGGAVAQTILTNANGQYRLAVAPGTYDVVFDDIGSIEQRRDGVTVAAGQTVTLDVVLPTRAIALDPIVVSGSRGNEERRTESVATVHSVNALQISERPSPALSDHLIGAPGVDLISTGVQSANVVVRGFNNIFSGALHMLTDHRLAGVPSLRVNLMHFIPTTEEDVERMEVVLGPGSALYGPNTANGVVHILTKSPIDSEGTSVTLGGGEQSVFQGSLRSAWALSPTFGIKFSGQYLKGDEWPYLDPTEEAARIQATTAGAPRNTCIADKIARGLNTAQANEACDRVGERDFAIERWSGEVRADWRFAEDGAVIATYGRTDATGIELTGLGAGQTGNWIYEFYQARANKGRLFGQLYYNTSDAGDTYLLRSGTDLVDESTLFVGQLQHGLGLADGRQDFTYGFDYYATRPETQGTINGSYEDDDDIDEWGIYLQSKTALTEQLDLVLAGRVDDHSLLADKVFSPRAGIVYRPIEGHSFRLSYNRAFSTPSSLNYFLDISGGLAPAPLSSLGYTVRAFGTGKDGWSLQPNGVNNMRSICPGTPTAPFPTPDASALWPCIVGILQAQGAISSGTASYLNSNAPAGGSVPWMFLDPNTSTVSPVAGTTLPAVEPIEESYTESYELGWTGVFANALSVSADVYYMKKNDFVSPLIVQTPLYTMNGPALVAHLSTLGGLPPGAAVTLGTAMAGIPLGVLAAPGVGPNTSPDLIATYKNIGDVELWGGDVAMQLFITDNWSLSGTVSALSDDYFRPDEGAPIALNSPELKGSLGAAYRNVRSGITGGARWRFQSEFPAESAGYVGTRCIGGAGVFVEDCVEPRGLWGLGGVGRALVDVNLGYEVPGTGTTLQLVVNNVFDAGYRSFVGVPRIGRFAMLSARYQVF
jgi:outer membrane receptor for ferrienterochelin and colicins